MGGGTMHPAQQFRSKAFSNLSSFSSSSSFSPNIEQPVSSDNHSKLSEPHSTLPRCSCRSQICRKMESLDSGKAKGANGCLYNHVFDPVPSEWEVEDAVNALQDFMQAVPSSSTLQQISGCNDWSMLLSQSQGYKRLYDALQLLQTDPSIKRLVVSLSSDKAIWDAVLNNLLHQKLLELPDSVENRRPQISAQTEASMHILSWIPDIIKGKILELIESFRSLVNDLFQPHQMENAKVDAAELDDKVRSSLLLSLVILLIVVMARSQSL